MQRLTSCLAVPALSLLFAASGGGVRAEETAYHRWLGPWQIAGPFPGTAKQADRFATDYLGGEAEAAPGKPVEYQGQTFTWKEQPAGPVNFGLAFDPVREFKNTVAYAATVVRSDSEKQAVLAVGADDGVQAWLNGEKVLDMVKPNGTNLDDRLTTVTLKPGENRLLFKVDNISDDWGLIARLLPAGASEPLLTFGYYRTVPYGVTRVPDARVELLGKNDTILSSHDASGYRIRGVGHVEYRLYGPRPDPEPEAVRVTMDVPGTDEKFVRQWPWKELAGSKPKIGAPGQLRLSGRVIDAETSRPVADARLTFGASHTTTTAGGPDGRFELTDLDPSFVRLSASAPGYQRTTRQVTAGSEEPVEIALTSGGLSLTGRVLDEKGRPIEGAIVQIPSSGGEFSDRTDAQGRYAIAGLSRWQSGGKPVESLYPVVKHSEFTPLDHTAVPVTKGVPIIEKDFTLKPGAVAVGRVTAKADGRPLEGITIQQGTDRFGSNTAIPETKTDAQGRFRLSGLKVGDNSLHAFSPDWAPAMAAASFGNTKETEINFELEPGRPVTGRVVDSEGKPLEGVRIVTDTWQGVRMFNRQVTTDREGRYEFRHMPLDEVESDFLKQGYSSVRNVKLKGGDSDVLTTLALPARLSGQVVDASTGEPIREFTIEGGYVWKSGGRLSWSDQGEKVSHAEGRFEKSDGELSNYDRKYRIGAPGYKMKELDVVLRAGDVVKDVRVALEKGTPLKGTVTDAEGRPVEGARVRRFGGDNQLWLGKYARQSRGEPAVTDREGRFSLDQAPEEKFSLYAEHDEAGAAFVLDMDPATTSPVVRLQPFGAVEGYVFAGPDPLKDAEMAVLQGNDRLRNVQIHYGGKTDENGHYRIEKVPPGTFNLVRLISVEGGSTTHYVNQRPVTVRSGQTTLASAGGEGGARVYGTVTDEAGTSLGGLSIVIRDQSYARTYGAVTDEEGRFEVWDVPAGKWTISAERRTFRNPGSTIDFSETLQVAEKTADVEKNLTVYKPTELAAGGVLPELSGKGKDDRPVALKERNDPRQLLVFASAGDAETKKKLEERIAALAKQQALLKEEKVGVLLLLPAGQKAEEIEQMLEKSGLEGDLLKLNSSWVRQLYKRFKPQKELPAMLTDRSGKILALVPDAASLEPALKEEGR